MEDITTQVEKGESCCDMKCGKKCSKMCGGYAGAPSCVYGLALIGAAIYYFGQADTFWMGVLGLLKALVWPAMLIYKLFGFLGM